MSAIVPASELPSQLADGPAEGAAGTTPWRVSVRRFSRNRGAVAALAMLVVIIVCCVLAPVYAHDLAHTNPFASNPLGTTVVHGKTIPVIAQNPDGLGTTPIGPTWTFRYFLGADTEGRDVAARLLYAGRVSLTIGVISALLNALLSTVIGLVAGYFGGWIDAIISRILDLIWAFPVYLVAIALASVLMVQGLHIGPVNISPTSIWLPIWLIVLIYIPYMARPIRAEAQSLRRREFIESAIGQGISTKRIIFGELLPNVIPTVIVFLPLMIATNMLTESALSYLGVGVQPPNASWGTMISDGQAQLYTRPLVSIAPGVALTLTILLLNVVADATRDAIDPHGVLPRGRRFGFLRPKRGTARRRAVSSGVTSQ